MKLLKQEIKLLLEEKGDILENRHTCIVTMRREIADNFGYRVYFIVLTKLDGICYIILSKEVV